MTSPAGPHSEHAVLVEACCDSVSAAVAAVGFGAGRVELCGPGDGGTTPSAGLMALCREAVRAPIHVMIRPHTQSFVYDADDMAVMCRDIVAAQTLGMEGVVLGPLRSDGTVHREQLATLCAVAGPMRVAFHRAFDRTPDAAVALDVLIDHGVGLVLTSGHAASALSGADTLRTLRQQAGARLTILAGGSVRGDNVVDLVRLTGVTEVHARSTDPSIIRDVMRALRSA